jgi:hypothetical protein
MNFQDSLQEVKMKVRKPSTLPAIVIKQQLKLKTMVK